MDQLHPPMFSPVDIFALGITTSKRVHFFFFRVSRKLFLAPMLLGSFFFLQVTIFLFVQAGLFTTRVFQSSTSFLIQTMTITIVHQAPAPSEVKIRHTQPNVTLHVTPVSTRVQNPGTLYIADE